MRHRLKGRKLGRTTSHRQAMARNLVTSLFVYGRVITTVTRAKEFRGLAERMITLAKNASGKDAPTRLAHLRRILRTVQDRKVARKILDDVAKRFTDRAGGYTRILKLGGSRWDGDGRDSTRSPLGDNGPKAIWELVVRKDREEEMKLAGRGRAAHEAEEAKRAEKKSKKAPGGHLLDPGARSPDDPDGGLRGPGADMNDCIFCRIVRGQIPAERIFENDRILAILDINPVAPGHALVLVKPHHEQVTDLPPDLLAEWSACSQEIARGVVKAAAAEGFNLLSNNHRCSGQAIPHVHLHIIPRRTGDGIRFSWTPAKYKDGEMAAWGEKIRTSMGAPA